VIGIPHKLVPPGIDEDKERDERCTVPELDSDIHAHGRSGSRFWISAAGSMITVIVMSSTQSRMGQRGRPKERESSRKRTAIPELENVHPESIQQRAGRPPKSRK
jgi:hypothetical protein